VRRRDFIAGLGGAAIAWPLAARAQQTAVPAVGFLSGLSRDAEFAKLPNSIRKGLSEQGYVEGRNVEILYRWAEGWYDRLPALAADLVLRRVAVIIAAGSGTPSAIAAKSATATIPIVFVVGSDPVALGLVPNLNRPGGNITGVSFLVQALTAKRLELLHEIVPAATSIGFLVDPRTAADKAEMTEAEIAARTLGLRLVVLNASSQSEIEAAFTGIEAQQVGALLTTGAALFAVQGVQLAALAARHALPAIYHSRATVEAGGLMSYGTIADDTFRLAGVYVGRILKGEKPGDLPVQQSTRFEMALNLKTAKALGIEVPTATLLRADTVIE
jgi:putative tryptophan/tyrosine transport system substrate-binding protein